jgi:hypothetical protein
MPRRFKNCTCSDIPNHAINKIGAAFIKNKKNKEYIWIDKNYDRQKIHLGSVLEKFVIPTLLDKGIM